MNRRHFLQQSAALWSFPPFLGARTDVGIGPEAPFPMQSHIPLADGSLLAPIDLSPARWIWYPMGRCLPSTVVLLRREVELQAPPKAATGWSLADSRYKLTVNGKRVQWGPAPCDPRWQEADPLDLAPFLKKGKNVIGAQVLFYGEGDGTWVMGKPGFLFLLNVECADGSRQQVVSDSAWQACVARSWRPGTTKRWYLRAFQEEFDARLYPYGWHEEAYEPDGEWRAAAEYSDGGDKPSICSRSATVMESEGDPKLCSLRARSVPMLNEVSLTGFTLRESAIVEWRCSPEQYFECVPPDACTGTWTNAATQLSPSSWRIDPNPEKSTVLTFARNEQVVGWPCFTVEAPAGTVIEILVHEAHQPRASFLINTHFNSWTRFICREGENHFETFDFEAIAGFSL